MKYILVIGDGMADNPVPALGGLTPLQKARIPTMDRLAAKGVVGHVCNCPKPLPAGSETAILSIFGCDPLQYFTGRSPMEAAASGIVLRPGEVAYRCNLISLEDGEQPYENKKILSHSAGSIDGPSALRVVEILESDPEFRAAEQAAGMVIHPFPAFRQIAVQTADIRGIKLIPPHDHLDEAQGPYLPSGCETAKTLDKLMRIAHRVLDHHPFNDERRRAGKLPANGIWFWAEGSAAQLPSFQKQYGGRTGGVISAVPLCHGIGVLRGLQMIEVEGATGEIDTNYEGKCQAALDLLHTDADFCAIHLEAPDECTHNGDLKGKIQSVEWLDSRIVEPLLRQLDAENMEYRVLLLSDHKTLTATRGHDGDPVPFLLYDSRADTGFGGVYDEATGMKGPQIPAGCQLLDYLFEMKTL